jgi:hypothetical protein
VNERRVVWTCCKNNDGKLGPRSVWERQSGQFGSVKDFDWDEWDHPSDGRSSRKLTGTVDDLLELIPADGIILKDDLYEQAAGKISRDNIREFLAELLRQQDIFLHRIPRPGKKSAPAYSRQRPGESTSETSNEGEDPDGFGIEDDPR